MGVIKKRGVTYAGGGGGAGGVDYSTTEQNTGRKWIDGKDIYVCTWNKPTTVLNFTANTWVDSTVPASLLIDKVINSEFIVNGAILAMSCAKSSTVFLLNSPRALSTSEGFALTVYYTKSS